MKNCRPRNPVDFLVLWVEQNLCRSVSIHISNKNSKIISLTNAIALDFLDDRFVMAKRKCISIFLSHFCKMLHCLARFQRDHFGRFNPRYLLPPPGNVPRCWLITLERNINTGVSFSGKGCASLWAHLHPAFDSSLPGENRKCFERKIFFQYFSAKCKYASQRQRKFYWRVFSCASESLNNDSF